MCVCVCVQVGGGKKQRKEERRNAASGNGGDGAKDRGKGEGDDDDDNGEDDDDGEEEATGRDVELTTGDGTRVLPSSNGTSEREEGQEKKQYQEQEDGASRPAASTSVSSGNLQESGPHSVLGSLTGSKLDGGTEYAKTVEMLKQEAAALDAKAAALEAWEEELKAQAAEIAQLRKTVRAGGQDAPSNGLSSHELV